MGQVRQVDAQPTVKHPLHTSLLRKTKGGRFASDTGRAIRAVIHGFRGEHIDLRASALTYITIFSLVPLLTVTLVLIRALHQEAFQQRMIGFMNDLLAPGVREETAAALHQFVDRASSAAAGGIGFVMLLISAISLLRNLDASLNKIWNVRRQRPLHVRLLIYLVLLTVGPLLVAASLVGTAGLRTALLGLQFPYWRQVFASAGLLTAIAAFTFLYQVAPNAPVRFRSALAGGLIAGSGWDLAKLGYAEFGARIFRFNPIYGSLGAAPLFFTWIYLSWLLVLFGCRLAYAVQLASFQGTYRELGDHPRARELVAAQMAQVITLAQFQGLPAPSHKEIAQRLDVPEDTIRELGERMELAGLVMVGRRGGLVPAKDTDELTVAALSAAVGGMINLSQLDERDKSEELKYLEGLFAEVDQASFNSLGRVTWRKLIAPQLAQLAETPTQRRIPVKASGRIP